MRDAGRVEEIARADGSRRRGYLLLPRRSESKVRLTRKFATGGPLRFPYIENALFRSGSLKGNTEVF